ncbi:sigma-70 family RNA polymerase sigma factor [Phyllobacterium sp. 0TCS1.6C]|uniref:sigma-70 family RNA polymerase sigma factor n=1 Tax=unclassified Phyllobacterium TaxID=2638441 RepID=UPI0022642CEE|nr:MULTISPECIES: sigma-70 family RNA polymerase sigma factor [unclassified Phyllobacterium]MCX8280306.1 sigma-70 family RNA polymerase sigma factor [Phyllobacterium sp. 0TCS1.6C]MCX8294133.1 sigma-70 family RNA polymerase sigma factor [Phyllobacterium sp. 0TCS1.6A]
MKDQDPQFDVLSQLGSLRRYARTLAGNDQDAEDLVHDALVRAYERQSSFRTGSNLRSWLFSVLHNVFIDRFRSKRSEARKIEQAGWVTDTVQAPPQEHSARLGQVRRAFGALPEEQRGALHLVAVEGLSYEEAAAILGVPVGTLMSRLSRARAAMRDIEENPPQTGKLRLVGGRDDQEH